MTSIAPADPDDIYDEDAPRRKPRYCVCGLEGYPGYCPGAAFCSNARCEEDEDEE